MRPGARAALLGLLGGLSSPGLGRAQSLVAGPEAGARPRATEVRIVFAQDGDRLQMHVQARFEGAADRFGWLVPVPTDDPASIDFEPGSWSFFELLQTRTGPRLRLERRFDPTTCNVQPKQGFGCGPEAAPAVIRVEPEDAARPGVDARVADPTGGSVLSATEVPAWLADRGLATDELTETTPPDLRFVAVEVVPDGSSGWIEPIVVRFRASQPVLPLGFGPAQIPVRVWLFEDALGIPADAPLVTLNSEHLDWFEGAPDYLDRVADALAEAGPLGGWVWESAGSTSRLRSALVPEGGFGSREGLAGIEDARRFVGELDRRGFAFDAVLLDVLRDTVDYPQAYAEAGVAPDAFYAHPRLYLTSSDADRILGDAIVSVDGRSAADAVWRRIVDPALNAQDMITRSAQVSRLLTLRQPDSGSTAFTYRALPVGPSRSAEYVQSCRDDGSSDGGWLTLPDGRTFYTDRDDWAERERDAPYAVRIERATDDGVTSIVDNTDRITPSDPPDAANGCRTVGPSNLALWGVILAAWALRRTRRFA